MLNTIRQIFFKLYIGISISVAYLSTYYRIYKEQILIWVLTNISEVIWKWLWMILTSKLLVDIRPYNNVEIKNTYRLKWGFYFGLNNDICYLNINYMYNIIKNLPVNDFESKLSLTFEYKDKIKEIDIDFINQKYKYNNCGDIWHHILYKKIKI